MRLHFPLVLLFLSISARAGCLASKPMIIDNINKISPDEKCEPSAEDVRRDNQNPFGKNDMDLVIKFCRTGRDGTRLFASKTDRSMRFAPETDRSKSENTALNLSWLNLKSTPVNCETFGKALKNFPNVERINLSHNNLGILSSSNISGLFDSFYKLKKLKFLDLSNNSIFSMQKISCDLFFDLILEDRNKLYLYLGNNKTCDQCDSGGGSCAFIRTLNRRGFATAKTSAGETLFLFCSDPDCIRKGGK
jgi:Leucine-rich repeat (LRR) protein